MQSRAQSARFSGHGIGSASREAIQADLESVRNKLATAGKPVRANGRGAGTPWAKEDIRHVKESDLIAAVLGHDQIIQEARMVRHARAPAESRAQSARLSDASASNAASLRRVRPSVGTMQSRSAIELKRVGHRPASTQVTSAGCRRGRSGLLAERQSTDRKRTSSSPQHIEQSNLF